MKQRPIEDFSERNRRRFCLPVEIEGHGGDAMTPSSYYDSNRIGLKSIGNLKIEVGRKRTSVEEFRRSAASMSSSLSLSFSSSLLDSPIHQTYNPKPLHHRANYTPFRSALAPPTTKKKHWKQGEFPGFSESSITGLNRKPPVKNIKKKLDRKDQAAGWVSTVSEALADRIQKKQWLEALQVFEMLREQPYYSPKEGTYKKLLVLLGRSGQPQHARQLFDLMLEEGLEPTAELYTALLAAYCRSELVDEAFAILNQMKGIARCQPDVYTYSTLIKVCVDACRFELVESLYDEMKERDIVPNTVTQNIVLSGYGKAGKYDMMERVLSGMLESTECRPDVWTMNTILSLFGSEDIEMMEKWYEKFRNFGIEPETRTFNILIGAYGKKRLYDKMSSVMEYMRKLAFPWTTSTYNNVIDAFADVGDAKNMEYTFEQMRAEGMRADTKTFCCLIRGYANAGLFHKVVDSVQLAGKLEIPENTLFYNAVILACAKADDLLEMEKLYNRMKDKLIRANSETFTTMVEAYRKVGMSDKIFDLEQEQKNTVADESNTDLFYKI